MFVDGVTVWALLSCYRERFNINGDSIAREGIAHTKSVRFKDINDLKWRIWPAGGSVVLRSPNVRMPIDFEIFDPSEQLSLIRWLRSAVPEEVQSGWPEFCRRWAVRLLDRDQSRPMREGEVRLTRAAA